MSDLALGRVRERRRILTPWDGGDAGAPALAAIPARTAHNRGHFGHCAQCKRWSELGLRPGTDLRICPDCMWPEDGDYGHRPYPEPATPELVGAMIFARAWAARGRGDEVIPDAGGPAGPAEHAEHVDCSYPDQHRRRPHPATGRLVCPTCHPIPEETSR
jgi:hypothetical protein